MDKYLKPVNPSVLFNEFKVTPQLVQPPTQSKRVRKDSIILCEPKTKKYIIMCVSECVFVCVSVCVCECVCVSMVYV